MPRQASKPDVTAEERSAVPAVDRAIAVLDLLASAPSRRFPLADVARLLSLPKSTALNLLGALERGGMVRRSSDGYQLGRRLVQLGSDYVASVDPVREFYEVCRTAPADLGALVQLSVLDDEINAVFLAREDLNSGLRLGLTAEIGRRVPAYLTASGKALLAALDTAEFEVRLARATITHGPTPNSASTPEQVRSVVARTRSEGLGEDDEETVPGITCVGIAVPTTQRDADHIGISISAAKKSLDTCRRKLIRDTLVSLAQSLTGRL